MVRLERLCLRELRTNDLPQFLEYRSDPQAARLQGWEPMSEAEALEFLQHHASGTGFVAGEWSQVAIADATTDVLVGDMGVFLSSDSSTAEFGITISPTAQGKGFAVEAIRGLLELLFGTTPVVEVVACTDTRNAPCIAALTRAGMFRIEAREAVFKGEPCVEMVFRACRPQT